MTYRPIPNLPSFPSFIDVEFHTSWEHKFIFFKKINGSWVICRHVYKRRHVWMESPGGRMRKRNQYALNDFDMIRMSGEK